MATVVVNFDPVIVRIREVLGKASEEVQRRATYNALNFVGDKARTQVRRAVSKQTSVPYGRVMKDITSTRAHPGRLSYVINARDQAIPLKEFMVGKQSAGAKKVTVKVWGKQRTIKRDVFLIGPKGGSATNILKRTSPHNAGPGHGPLGAKQLWGPIVPKEMLREGEPSMNYLDLELPIEFVGRLQHEIEQAMIRAIA